jgi:ribosomal protein S18 acetylase RimI-like enzyme
MDKIRIRTMIQSDCITISKVFQAQGWNKQLSLYETYYSELQEGKRDVLIAEFDNEIAGYVTIQWKSPYIYFNERGIPEIKDLNTLLKFRNNGIATELMNCAEELIQQKGYSTAGIGFGLYSDYGIAQRMYIKRGYNFDGRGLLYNGEVIEPGNHVRVDDSLTLSLLKKLP